MTEERTAVVELPGSSGAPTPKTLLSREAAREGYQRLGLITGLIGGAVAVALLIWLLEYLGGDRSRPLSHAGGVLTVLLATVAVFIGCRRRLFPEAAFVLVALAVEVIIALSLGVGLLGWQHRVGEAAVAWHTAGTGAPPFALGTGEMPWVGIWIILFAALMPLRPGHHLLGGILSAATLLVWPTVSLVTLGVPAVMEPVRAGVTLHVTIWLFARGLFAVGIGYFAARSVHGLRKELVKARQLGSYHLREKLGEGGMGEVWRADHRMLARPAAIKLIKPDANGGGTPWHEMTHRFEREVQAAAQLRSPHTIEIYDYGLTEDGTFYYVMELLDGLDLAELVKAHGPITWPRAVHILKQVCHSLAEAHERGMIHRDIKPANIFLCRVGRDVDQVKVLDFGLVKTTGAQSGDAELTQKGQFVGTPAYAPPELGVGGFEHADQRSDLYSVGCVAFWLLCGETVFQAATPMEMLIQHARDEPPVPSRAGELEVPLLLDRIVLDCLAKDPDLRPHSADDLATRLAAVEQLGTWTGADADAWWALHLPRRRPGPTTLDRP